MKMLEVMNDKMNRLKKEKIIEEKFGVATKEEANEFCDDLNNKIHNLDLEKNIVKNFNDHIKEGGKVLDFVPIDEEEEINMFKNEKLNNSIEDGNDNPLDSERNSVKSLPANNTFISEKISKDRLKTKKLTQPEILKNLLANNLRKMKNKQMQTEKKRAEKRNATSVLKDMIKVFKDKDKDKGNDKNKDVDKDINKDKDKVIGSILHNNNNNNLQGKLKKGKKVLKQVTIVDGPLDDNNITNSSINSINFNKRNSKQINNTDDNEKIVTFAGRVDKKNSRFSQFRTCKISGSNLFSKNLIDNEDIALKIINNSIESLNKDETLSNDDSQSKPVERINKKKSLFKTCKITEPLFKSDKHLKEKRKSCNPQHPIHNKLLNEEKTLFDSKSRRESAINLPSIRDNFIRITKSKSQVKLNTIKYLKGELQYMFNNSSKTNIPTIKSPDRLQLVEDIERGKNKKISDLLLSNYNDKNYNENKKFNEDNNSNFDFSPIDNKNIKHKQLSSKNTNEIKLNSVNSITNLLNLTIQTPPKTIHHPLLKTLSKHNMAINSVYTPPTLHKSSRSKNATLSNLIEINNSNKLNDLRNTIINNNFDFSTRKKSERASRIPNNDSKNEGSELGTYNTLEPLSNIIGINKLNINDFEKGGAKERYKHSVNIVNSISKRYESHIDSDKSDQVLKEFVESINQNNIRQQLSIQLRKLYTYSKNIVQTRNDSQLTNNFMNVIVEELLEFNDDNNLFSDESESSF